MTPRALACRAVLALASARGWLLDRRARRLEEEPEPFDAGGIVLGPRDRHVHLEFLSTRRSDGGLTVHRVRQEEEE